MNDVELLECMHNPLLLSQYSRRQLLERFSSLNAAQKQQLSEHFLRVKKYITSTLIHLKNTQICSFESIHTKILQKTKQHIQRLESQEGAEEFEQIQHIFDSW